MLNKDDTLIILGKSPFLDKPEIADYIYDLNYKYTVVGINHAAYIFKTEYFAFVDHGLMYYYNLINPTTKIITLEKYAREGFEGEYFNIFIPEANDSPVKEGSLAYCGFTHDLCISWAYLKGFKNVVLLGASDFTEEKTYIKKCASLPDRPTRFNASDKLRDQSVNYINNVASKYINIYTVNPDSILSVERISIRDLTN